MQIIFRFT